MLRPTAQRETCDVPLISSRCHLELNNRLSLSRNLHVLRGAVRLDPPLSHISLRKCRKPLNETPENHMAAKGTKAKGKALARTWDLSNTQFE